MRKRRRQIATITARAAAVLVMAATFAVIHWGVILLGGTEWYQVLAGNRGLTDTEDRKEPQKMTLIEAAGKEPPKMLMNADSGQKMPPAVEAGASVMIPLPAMTIQETDLDQTVTDMDPGTESGNETKKPDVKISITEPSGWHNGSAVIKVYITDLAESRDFFIRSVRARPGGYGGTWYDITESTMLETDKNGIFTVEVTDAEDRIYTAQTELTCFDLTAPSLTASVTNGLLTVKASDYVSGIDVIYVNGFEFTNHADGALSIRLEQYDVGTKYFTVQARDRAGNLSQEYRVSNPYYKKDQTSQGSGQAVLPITAGATKPATAEASVTEHVKTDSIGNLIAGLISTDDKKKETEEEKPSLETIPGQGREFYTIEARSGKVFYLIIDRNGENEAVHFVTDITENDLLNVTEANSETLPRNSAVPADALTEEGEASFFTENTTGSGWGSLFSGTEKQEAAAPSALSAGHIPEAQDTESSEEPPKPSGQNRFYLILAILCVIVIAVAYVLKKRKWSRNEEFDREEEEEDLEFDDEEDQPAKEINFETDPEETDPQDTI